MRARLACALLAATLLSPRAAWAQRLEASGGGTVTVGDTVTIVLRATLPAGATIAADPHPRDSLPNSVHLLALDTLPRAADGARRYRARIAFFQTGSLTSPAFALGFRRAGQESADSVVSGAVLVTVTPTLPDTAVAMRDIRPIASLGGSARGTSQWWIVAVAALVLAAVAAVVLRRRPRRRAPMPVAPAATPLGAFESARQRLVALAPSAVTALNVAAFYDDVTDVLRRYLEAEFGVPAVHRTTPELLHALPPFLAHTDLATKSVLGEADFVKFARLRPGAQTAHAFLAGALTLLDEWHDAAQPGPNAEAADALR
ncbi:MAG TPA: hypothetical protein VJO52_15120 [Gemmatimonadaceae bacterium]|nr:hypothetical protein [Gemmatimonadaceae bacterium]